MASSWNGVKSHPNGPIDQGYYVRLPNLEPDAAGQGINGANGYIESVNGERVWLWINEISTDFALAGNYAQSKSRRSYFPRNLVQPSLTVAGQTPNSYQFNRLSEFIRETQLRAIQGGNSNNIAQGMVSLVIPEAGPLTRRPIVKGRRQGISLHGYIDMAQRGAERWINAPDYSFNFIITQAHALLGLDDANNPVRRLKMKNFLQILTDPSFGYSFEKGTQNDESVGQETSPENKPPQGPF